MSLRYWVEQARRLDAIMTPQKIRTLNPFELEALVEAIDSLAKKVLTPNGDLEVDTDYDVKFNGR